MHALRRVGRRGAALAVLAAVDVCYGTALLAGHTAAATAAVMVMPLHLWGWVWIGAAAVLAAGVPLTDDRWHYGFAALFKTFWALLIAWHWLAHREHGGWGAAMAWLGLAALVLLISGWPEPPRPAAPP